MTDWEENPDSYLKDDKGEFILKKDGTPKKVTGRPKGSKSRSYSFHSETKLKWLLKEQSEKSRENRQAKVSTSFRAY